MSATLAGAGALQVVGVAACPLASGVIQRLKGVLQGRSGPSVLQPYRELRRLWGKSAVDPQPTTALYRLAPPLTTACVAIGLLLVPFAGRSPNWGLGNDALVLVGLLTLGRFAIAAAAWDTGSGFGLMGASRDLTFAVFIEGALLLVFLLAALPAGGSTDLISMSHAASRGEVWNQPAHWCAGVAFVLVALAETGRQPVDNPDTHLELTMIHEGPLLEYAGRDLACLQWAASARLWLMLLLAAQLFAPTAGGFGVRAVILVATIGLLVVGLAVIETSLAKMRILRVPVFLAGGASLCVIGLASWLAGGGV
jgi:formate hydrogenlyase subunit 4